VPAARVPEEDGLWFHIDIYSVDGHGPKDAEPVILKMCFGPKKRVQFLVLEGPKANPVSATLFSILRSHGVKPCGV
jgi:hypothetical protein